ncbi:hypothetical protein K4K49_002066 [Colletotrichum sp. SAR 10_70]|nr:hypothetical protein K4K50_005310 [Colletotrichum sp. SAR 10_71]KAI8177632.1 hypothetical protein K4K49_002066 [Colletotrichum sp. SAR 10_70]
MVNKFLNKSNNDPGWTLTHYVHRDEFRTYEAMQRRTNSRFNLDHFLLLNPTQTGGLQQNRIVLIECDEEFDIHYAVGMFQLARTIGNTLESNRSARLRIIFMSSESDPDVDQLARKLSMFTSSNIERLEFTLFDYPDPHTCSFLEDLTWETYPVDDATFLQQVAAKIAPDFSCVHDAEAEDGKGSNTRDTAAKTVFLWDGIRREGGYQPETLIQALDSIVGKDAFNIATHDDTCTSGLDTSKPLLINMGKSPRLATLPAGTKHLILCNKKRQVQFDTETTHNVVIDARVSRAELMCQAELAFTNTRNDPAGFTVHSQLSLDDIKAIRVQSLFEETHLESFMVLAWHIDPELDLDRLLDHFVDDARMLESALRHLELLGLLAINDEDYIGFNRTMFDKVAAILPTVDFSIQTAVFLSQVTNQTPHAQRQAMVDLAAIVLRFHPATEQSPFIRLNDKISSIGSLDGVEGRAKMDEIAKACVDVPPETVFEGSIWLALGIYRKLYQILGPHSLPGQMHLGSTLLIVEGLQYDYIRQQANRINKTMTLTTPPATQYDSPPTNLQPADISVLQTFMLRAWCSELVYVPYTQTFLDVVSRTVEDVQIERRTGFFQEMAGQRNSFLVAFDYFKDVGGKGEASVWSIRLAAQIPNAMVAQFLKSRGLLCADLETRFPIYRT